MNGDWVMRDALRAIEDSGYRLRVARRGAIIAGAATVLLGIASLGLIAASIVTGGKWAMWLYVTVVPLIICSIRLAERAEQMGNSRARLIAARRHLQDLILDDERGARYQQEIPGRRRDER